MPSLLIPESGLSLASSPEASSKPGFGVADVFGISLTDSVIEEMIRCMRNKKPIQLSLGEHPSISYGSKLAHLGTTIDDFPHELYHTNLPISNLKSTSSNSLKMGGPPPNINKGTAKVENKPHAQFLAMFQNKKFKVTKTTKATSNQTPASSTNKSGMATAVADAAVTQLKNSLASENLKKQENTIKYIKDSSGLPGQGRKGAPASKVTNKSKFLSQNSRGSDTTRSMPSSPNLAGMGSPLVGPTSVPLSQLNADKAKTARKPIVHLLALGPTTKKELRAKIDEVSDQEFENVLAKVGDLNESTGKYELRKNPFKELDVWTFNYDSSEDRQKAIDNAVKVYDKMRLGLSEPEWDRLLVRTERGSGKHLSKLQAQIAAGPIARPPKINVEKAEGSGRDTPSGKDEDSFSDKNISKVKGESMSRSISQPPNTKAKKVSEKEAQTKRLLSKNPSKAAPANKPAPAKKAPQSKTSGKVLSSEFVNNSDEDDDYPPNPKSAPKPSIKRSREEDDVETSDSSVPLAKKVKKDTPSSHRISDASQSSRTTHTSHYSSGSSKKDTSPQKSSPLASSPPTNASEFENSSSGSRTSSSTSPAHHTSTKANRSPIHKRHQKSSSVASSASSNSSTRNLKSEIVDIARKYRMYYPTYEALHRELMEIGEHRDKAKEMELLDMHERLAGMKAQIIAGIVMEDTN